MKTLLRVLQAHQTLKGGEPVTLNQLIGYVGTAVELEKREAEAEEKERIRIEEEIATDMMNHKH